MRASHSLQAATIEPCRRECARHLALLRLDERDQREHGAIDDAGDHRQSHQKAEIVSAWPNQASPVFSSSLGALMRRHPAISRAGACHVGAAAALTQPALFMCDTRRHERRSADERRSTHEVPDADRAALLRAGSAQRSIVFVGLMGAGKTAIGRKVAASSACPSSTATTRSKPRRGMTVPELFELYGEAEFRALEQRVIAAPARSTARRCCRPAAAPS